MSLLLERCATVDEFKVAVKSPELAPTNVEDPQLINQLWRYYEMVLTGKVKKKKSNVPMTKGTISQIRLAIQTLAEYASVEGGLDLSDHDLYKDRTTQQKRQKAKEWGDWWAEFIDYMIELEWATVSQANTLVLLGTAIKWIKGDLFIELPPVPSVKSYEKAIIIIDPEHIPGFLNDSPYEQMNDVHKFIWEVCAVMLVTAMRRSDAMALSWNMLDTSKPVIEFTKRIKKTGQIKNFALTRLLSDRIRANYARFGSVYTPTTITKTVAIQQIHEFFKDWYGWSRVEKTISEYDARGNECIMVKPLYDLITCHTMRKSAITSMLAFGMDKENVSALSGHADGSRSFWRYVGYVESRYTGQVHDYRNKFLEANG